MSIAALIISPNSVNVYCPAFFADCILENEEVSEAEWRTNVVTDSFSTGHNVSLYAKSVREKFMDYFVNDGAVEWQWNYCKETVVNFNHNTFISKKENHYFFLISADFFRTLQRIS